MTKLEWFNDARYGMFVHWGAYSVAGRGEWVLNRERIPFDEYKAQYVDNFHAEKFDAKELVRVAKASGMKYMVLTTRHHDGLCMWDTKTSDFNTVRLGPKRDLVREFADAVRDAGLGLGFYYSAADWHHADYPTPYARDWPTEWPDETKRQRFVAYYRSQLAELMSEYGPVDILWYDGCIPEPLDGAEVNEYIRTLQPDILINNRNGGKWDFQCSEQAIKPAPAGTSWEATFTLNDNWGYHAGDTHYKDAKQVLMMLTETASNGGNLLINIGPRGDGSIPNESTAILAEVGEWLSRNPRWLPNSSRSPFSWNNWGRLTTNGARVYAHIFHSPGTELCIAEIKNKVTGARWLASGKEIAFEQQGERLFLRGLPATLPDPLMSTIEIDIVGEPEALSKQETFWIPG